MTVTKNPFFQLPNKNPLTFHVFADPMTPCHIDACSKPFAGQSRHLCWMLKSLGHKVYHYGNELSIDKEHPERGVWCDEHISVTTEEQLMEANPNWRNHLGSYYMSEGRDDEWKYLFSSYSLNAAYEAKKRYKPNDIFCWVNSERQIDLWNQLCKINDVRHVETGIGYFTSIAPYRIFASSQIQGWHYGYFANNFDRYKKLDKEDKASYKFNANTHIAKENIPDYDAVIPHAFDVKNFDFKLHKGDKILFLGRILLLKGLRTAIEIADRLQMTLVVAGPGDFEKALKMKPTQYKYVEFFGPANAEERRELLSDSAVMLCLSTYWEPCAQTQIEAMLSGTVPIGTNSGGFYQNIRSGYNGYRIGIDSVEQGIWAVENVDKIDPYNLRDFGLRYSREQIALQYNDYFQSLDSAIRHNDEVYSIQNPDRAKLDWVDYDRKIEWPEGWMTPMDTKKGE